MPEIRIDVYSDQHGAPENLKRTEDALIGVERQGDATHGGLEKLWKQFAIGTIVAQVTTKVFNLFKTELLSTVDAAQKQENADKALSAALEITGRKVPLQAMKDYASSLQSATKYGDEEIQGVQTLLVQMTRLNKEGIEKATKGAIGLATVMGMDLQGAGLLVTKALEGNYAALSRYGIKLDESLSASEKQAQLLEKLAGFYKRAEADVDTYAGRLAQLKNAYDDLKETIGDFVIKNQSVIDTLSGMKAIIEWLNKYTAELSANQKRSWLEMIPPVRSFMDSIRLMGLMATEDLNRMARVEAAGKKNAEELWAALLQVAPTTTVLGINLQEAITWFERLFETADEGSIKLGKLQKLLTPEEIAASWEKATSQAREALEKNIGQIVEGMSGWQTEIIEVDAKWTDFTNSVEGGSPILEEALSGLTYGFEGFADAVTKTDLEREIKRITNTLLIMGDALPTTEIERLRNRIKELQEQLGETTGADKFKAAMDSIAVYTQVTFSGLNAIFSQSQTNREIAIENEYKKRLAFINKNITDEDARQKAVMALEAEYQIKKSEARAKGAKAAKAVALMEAIVNTASAITDALPNLILAAIVAAMGAVQIGVIAAQPIPLARGGVFTKRTRLTSDAGTAYEVGEGGEAEILAPGSAISKAVREGGGGRGASVTFNIQGPLAVFTGATERDLRAAGPILLDILEGEFNKFGMRLLHGRH